VLSAPTGGAAIGNGTGTVTIIDNDGAMLAAAVAPAGGALTPLTADALAPVVARAEGMWKAVLPGADFSGHTITIGDLPGGQLGWTDGGLTTIDATAAGFGWWTGLSAGGAGQMDLLTVVLHELGRVLGYTTDDAALFPVMEPVLSPDERLSLASTRTISPSHASLIQSSHARRIAVSPRDVAKSHTIQKHNRRAAQ
jgi:hypothetical protein